VNGEKACHWVLIETGGNQAYIFGTNRLRHVVGASHLIRELGAVWVREAAASCDAEVVVAISGKALLLVADPADGRAVISKVSARALAEAPGLEVTGVTGPGFDPELAWRPDEGDPAGTPDAPLTHVPALERTYELLEQVRMERPSALLRDPVLPWLEVCRESGLPVADVEDHPDGGAVAAAVLAKADARFAARDRMRELLSDLPGVVPADGEPDNDGWIAVIHADGNGIGRMFTDFPQRALRAAAAAGDQVANEPRPGLTLDRHKNLLKRFTRELEIRTETALGLAVRDATQGQDADGTILPVVFGGDDVTVVCHARFALGLVRAFVFNFEEQTADSPILTAIAGGPLTAAAGIAYVKPHHPFSAAYALAEELTVSAKQAAREGGPALSATDFHVAFESTLADLAVLRSRVAADGLPRHGGPYVITTPDAASAGLRDIRELDRTMATVAGLSSSMAHDLREGLARGIAEYERRVGLAALSPGRPDELSQADIRQLAPAGESGETGERVVRLLDALLLNAIARPRPSAQPGGSADAGSEPAGVRR
jgi:hypothetical protein